MKIEVLKFGGIATATKKSREDIVKIVKQKNNKIVLVVSAMGRLGFPYATDTLLTLIDEEKSTVEEKSRLLSTGEIISAVVVSNQLKCAGIKAYSPSIYELELEKYALNKEKIIGLFSTYDVLVIPGFIYLKNNEIHTYNRGGGDLSVLVVAKALQLSCVTLYKNILGVQPFCLQGYAKIRNYTQLNYDDAIALADIGYNVIQKEAVEFAKKHEIRIFVKNHSFETKGTLISSDVPSNEIVGVSCTRDSLFIASNNVKKVRRLLDNMFEKNYLYAKSARELSNFIQYKFNINQLNSAKKLVVEECFNNFL